MCVKHLEAQVTRVIGADYVALAEMPFVTAPLSSETVMKGISAPP